MNINLRASYCPDREYAHYLVERLPSEWKRPLIEEWQRRARPQYLWARRDRSYVEVIKPAANHWLTDLMHNVAGGPHGQLLGLSDSDIICESERLAQHCQYILRRFGFTENSLSAMNRIGGRYGIDGPTGKSLRPKMMRYTCSLFWRRQLRKVAGRCTESVAQHLGWVSRNRGSYVSHVALERRQDQIARNNETLEKIKMYRSSGGPMDDGVCTNLREIAEHTLSNKTIRRGELMLRARGFEEVARDLGHTAVFVTLTCPSRFHAMRIGANGQAEKNPSWDKSTPKEAQTYLVKTWAKMRAALARRGRTLYGIRVAEPHHDGCPHWHMLLFLPELPDDESVLSMWDVMQLMKEYALQDSPDEPGADKRRIDFVKIQPDEGSAAGYIAKYLAKNLDGAHIEQDLFGNPALVAAQRVDAWAATWGIRQFQQLGGAPVTVWRELRRCGCHDEESVNAMNAAPQHVKDAINAVNTDKYLPGTDRASWAEYIRAQGGPTIGRRAKIRLWMKEQKGVGQYGEPLAPRIHGIATTYTIMERFGIIPAWPVVKEFFLKSARKIWVKYKTFDNFQLQEYVSRIVKRRSTEIDKQGDSRHDKKRTKNQVRTLQNDGSTGEQDDSLRDNGINSRPAIPGHEQKRNTGRAYWGFLRLCGAGL